VNGLRPKSKKAIKEALADEATAGRVRAQATSWFGDEYDGFIVNAPVGTTVHFVGPDPERDRRFYGTIHVTSAGIKVT